MNVGTLTGVLAIDNQMADGVRRAMNDAERRFGEGGTNAADRFVVGADGRMRDSLTGRFASAGTDAGREFGDAAGDAAGDGGGSGGGIAGKLTGFLGTLGIVLSGAALAAGAAIGAVLAKGFMDAVEDEAGDDLLAAKLGLGPEDAAVAGSAAAAAYANNFGESMEETRGAVDAVWSTLGDDLGGVDLDDGGASLQRAAEQAITLAQLLGVDVGTAVNTAGAAIQGGLANNATEAFDLMAAAAQQMPSQMREELIPAVDEYGTFLASLGISGPEAFDLLARASQDGMYGIDKTGDALKELTILSTDMSDSSKDAYSAAGLNAEDMAARFLAGGDTARGALDDLVDGLLGIEDPVARSNAAIGLFGTPLEDLNVTEVPDFLRSLQNMGTGMEDTAGTVDGAAATIGDNASSKIESFKRRAQIALQDFVGDAALPFANRILDGLGGVWTDLSAAWEEGGAGGVVDRIGEMWEKGWPRLRERIGNLFERARRWLVEEGPGILRGAGAMAERFWDWVQDAYPAFARHMADLYGRAATWIAEVGAPMLASWLHDTGGPALWQWIQNVAPDVLATMATLWGELIAWVAATGVPWMQEQGAALGLALVAWLATDAGPALVRGLESARAALATWFVENAVPWMLAKGQDLFGQLVQAAGEKGNELVAWAQRLPGRIVDTLSNLGSRLLNAGRQTIQGFIDGVQDRLPNLEAIIRGLGDMIPDWVKRALGISSPSRVFMAIGADTVEGMRLGVAGQEANLRSQFAALTAGLQAQVSAAMPAAQPGGRWFEDALTGGYNWHPYGTRLEDGSVVSGGGGAGFDYDRMGTAVARAMDGRASSIEMDGRAVGTVVWRHVGSELERDTRRHRG